MPLRAQTGAIAGAVSDSTARLPLAGAVVEARQGAAIVARAVSGNDGALRLGRLPGDIVYHGRNTTIYFPIVTSIVLSVGLTLILWLVSVLRR